MIPALAQSAKPGLSSPCRDYLPRPLGESATYELPSRDIFRISHSSRFVQTLHWNVTMPRRRGPLCLLPHIRRDFYLPSRSRHSGGGEPPKCVSERTLTTGDRILRFEVTAAVCASMNSSNSSSAPASPPQRRKSLVARATGVCGMALIVSLASAQGDPAPAPSVAPNAGNAAKAGSAAQNTDAAQVTWTESLGQPSVYVDRARADVGLRHYKSAARNLRTAANILATRSKNTYALDRQRLSQDVKALRLTVKDVAAGAITSPALLDSALQTTHAYLAVDGTAPR